MRWPPGCSFFVLLICRARARERQTAAVSFLVERLEGLEEGEVRCEGDEGSEEGSSAYEYGPRCGGTCHPGSGQTNLEASLAAEVCLFLAISSPRCQIPRLLALGLF